MKLKFKVWDREYTVPIYTSGCENMSWEAVTMMCLAISQLSDKDKEKIVKRLKLRDVELIELNTYGRNVFDAPIVDSS